MDYITHDFAGAGDITSTPCPRCGTRSGPASNWLSVDLELPAFGDRVTARVDEGAGPRVVVDSYSGPRFGWAANGHYVTHWQPLPSAELGT